MGFPTGGAQKSDHSSREAQLQEATAAITSCVGLQEGDGALDALTAVAGFGADDAVGVDRREPFSPLRTWPPSARAWRKVIKIGAV